MKPVALKVSRAPLAPAQIEAQIAALPGWRWQAQAGWIEKTFTRTSYAQVLSFANAVARVAEQADHHPELVLRYSECVVRFCTHQPRGVSALDFACAQAVDALAVQ